MPNTTLRSMYPEEELEQWLDHDPIQSFTHYLVEFGFESEATLEDIRSQVAGELDAATDEVLSEAYPPADEARTRVYDDSVLDADVPWTRGPVPGYEGLTSGRPGSPASHPEGA